jgi:hypothetical protein
LVSIAPALRNAPNFDVTELAQHFVRYLREFSASILLPLAGARIYK